MRAVMNYNDEKLLSIDEYEVMAKAYSAHLRDKGFIFIQVDSEENNELIAEVNELFAQIKSSLFFLGNFLGTGRLYTLTDRQIKLFQTIYPDCTQANSYKIRGDKTKCFLNMIALESTLISKLLTLSENSPFFKQIDTMIRERLYVCGEIYKINGLMN